MTFKPHDGPRPGSPNALWAKHGFTIEREPRRMGSSKIRTIRNPQGEVVLHDAGLDAELAWIRTHLQADMPGDHIIGPSRDRYIITGESHGTKH